MKNINSILQEGEVVIKEETGTFVKSKLHARIGKLVLTNKRFLFVADSPLMYMFGLIGYFVAKKVAKKPVLDILLSDISVLEKTKYGLNNKAFKMIFRDGNEYIFTTSKQPDEFISAFKK